MNYNLNSATSLIANIAGNNEALALMERFGSLTALARADEHELTEVSGIGQATASAIKSALELAKQLSLEALPEAPLLDTPERVADLVREELRVESIETLYVLLLNVRRRLIKKVKISQGILDTLLVHPREVFRPAIVHHAAAIVLIHNHPSGSSQISDADAKVTRDLIRAGQLLKIEVLDHVILGLKTAENPKDYSSLRELGFFYA